MTDKLSVAPNYNEKQRVAERTSFCKTCTQERVDLAQEVTPPNRADEFKRLTCKGGQWQALEPKDRLDEACQILCDYEATMRKKAPVFNLTNLPLRAVQNIVGQKLTTEKDAAAAAAKKTGADKDETVKSKTETADETYRVLQAELKKVKRGGK